VFNRLFVRSDALNRQLSAPLADERRHYLANCEEQGMSHKTLRSKARILISIANHLKTAYRPSEQMTLQQIGQAASRWARKKRSTLPGPVQERMQFKTGDIGAPCQDRQIVDADIADGLAALLPGYVGGVDPYRRMFGCVLFVKRLSAHAVRESFHRHRALRIVRKHPRRDADVVIDDLSLGEAVARIESLVEIA
jgi:hypothetical protein